MIAFAGEEIIMTPPKASSSFFIRSVCDDFVDNFYNSILRVEIVKYSNSNAM